MNKGRIDRGSPTSSCFRLVYAESERQIRMKIGTLRRSGILIDFSCSWKLAQACCFMWEPRLDPFPWQLAVSHTYLDLFSPFSLALPGFWCLIDKASVTLFLALFSFFAFSLFRTF